jgi:uncharacterized protein with HEPN domain
MPREWLLYLDDIQNAIHKIKTYTEPLDFSGFAADEKTQDAVVRNLEVIGEAARLIPQEVRTSSHHIEWRKIIGLRNLLAHEYFGINLAIVWDVVTTKLDDLNDACEYLRLNQTNVPREDE